MMTYAYLIALVIITCVCLFGVLSHSFDDSLPQRLALSLICLGAVSRIVEVFTDRLDGENVRQLFTFGVALFCVSTSYKLWRQK